MASEDVKDAAEGLSALSVDEKTSNGVSEKWGLELSHLYQLAVKFYKGKEGTEPDVSSGDMIMVSMSAVSRIKHDSYCFCQS